MIDRIFLLPVSLLLCLTECIPYLMQASSFSPISFVIRIKLNLKKETHGKKSEREDTVSFSMRPLFVHASPPLPFSFFPFLPSSLPLS